MLSRTTSSPKAVYRSDVRIFLAVVLAATSSFITGCAFQRSMQRASASCPVVQADRSIAQLADPTAHYVEKYGPTDPTLEALLKRIAIDGDVIAAVSNHALMSAVRTPLA